jgi:hypothetical protein
MRKVLRRLPAGEFLAVLALSITLGSWPLWDQQWKYKIAYGVLVGGFALSACYFSARDRWRLEGRQDQRERVQLNATRATILNLQADLAQIVAKTIRTKNTGLPEPNIVQEFGPLVIRVVNLIEELRVLEVSAAEIAQTLINNNMSSVTDIRKLASAFEKADAELAQRIGDLS